MRRTWLRHMLIPHSSTCIAILKQVRKRSDSAADSRKHTERSDVPKLLFVFWPCAVWLRRIRCNRNHTQRWRVVWQWIPWLRVESLRRVRDWLVCGEQRRQRRVLGWLVMSRLPASRGVFLSPGLLFVPQHFIMHSTPSHRARRRELLQP